MLYTVDRFQVPGVIEAQREDVVKRVFIRDGNVVHATSNDRDDSLGAYLQRTGKITMEQFQRTMEARSEANKRYGELLIERGIVSPAAIYDAIRKQVESIVWSLFYWQEGEVRFQIGSFQNPGGVRIQLPMRQVIIEGIKRAPNAKALVGRLGKKETVFVPSYTTEDLTQAGLDEEEYRLVKLLDGTRSLYEVCTQGPLSPSDNAKLVYAFYVLRLIRRQEAESRAEAEPARAEREEPEAPERKAIKIRFKTAGDKFSR